jgi:hypothetical protein
VARFAAATTETISVGGMYFRIFGYTIANWASNSVVDFTSPSEAKRMPNHRSDVRSDPDTPLRYMYKSFVCSPEDETDVPVMNLSSRMLFEELTRPDRSVSMTTKT